MAETKDFHLGDILSITHGRLLSPRLMDGVYDILNWMTGEQLYTHQLPRVAREAKPVLLTTFPWLLEIDAELVDKGNWRAWLGQRVAKYGQMHPVPKLTEDQHERIDPLSEAAEHFPPDKIHVVPV